MKIDINDFGEYKDGMSFDEIREYLKFRAGVSKIGDLLKRFGKIAGVNTGAVSKDKDGHLIHLMYRHDVERFADLMFEGKETYFD